jgi:hypothetical protein
MKARAAVAWEAGKPLVNVTNMRAALECCHKGWGESVIIVRKRSNCPAMWINI